MAEDTAKKPGEFEKPAGMDAVKGDEPVIHVIPDRFYGGSAKGKMHDPTTLPPPPSAAPTASGPGQPGKPARKFPLAIVIIVLLVLIGGGAAAYFLFLQPQGEICGNDICASEEDFDSCPQDCPEPGPVCGDGRCEPPENTTSCRQDCRPATVCGNGECEEGENFGSCPGDCEPPVAVCGNGLCEEDLGEDYKVCPQDCVAPEPAQAPDTDSDGLTDDEEQLIYGSDPNRSNSDGDSYVDLNEVLNLFDPAKHDPAALIDNPGVAAYANTDYGIELYRPTAWTVREIVSERTVNFTAPTGEVFEVTIFTKAEDESLMDWYLDQPLDGITGQVESGENKKGYEQVISANRRVVFVSNGNTIVSLKYELQDQLEIRYRVTLTMMANSLTITGTAPIEAPAESASSESNLPVSGSTGNMEVEAPAEEPGDTPPPEEEPVEPLPER